MRLKLNFDLRGHKKGDIIDVQDKKGVPVDPYWRKRLKESEIDGCVEIYETRSDKIKKTKNKRLGVSNDES